MVKNLPAMQVTRVQSLGQEDPLEKEMATHSSILAWRIPWTKKAIGLQFIGVSKSWTQRVTNTQSRDNTSLQRCGRLEEYWMQT